MTTPGKGRIFISYRRADSAGYAGRIYDRLTARFDEDAIFMDVSTIDAGTDFVEVLQNAVRSCDVLVTLIGRSWLDIKDEAGNRRLDNPADFVRIEVSAALDRDIRVIPVLVDGVTMPGSTELPDNLRPLVRRNALQVNHQSFNADVQRLISQLELALKTAEEKRNQEAAEKAREEKEERARKETEKGKTKLNWLFWGIGVAVIAVILGLGTPILNALRSTDTPPDTSTVITTDTSTVITWRVLVLTFDPVMDETGTTLSQLMKWNSVDDLTSSFIADIGDVSGGLVRYKIVEQIDIDEFPATVDGYRYTSETYLDVLRYVSEPHMPQKADYYAIIDQYDILGRVARDEIDEVWIFGGPYSGIYETVMAGPNAFWCNAPPLENTEASNRRFIIMGFSFERYYEMLESFGHRAESIMEKVYSSKLPNANMWKRFTQYDLEYPGEANVGTMHFAPNSERDYDLDNPNPVPSAADDWFLYPNLPDPPNYRNVSARDWGNAANTSDIRLHHNWWLRHLPKAAGTTNGISNNWWNYIINPNTVIVDQNE